MSSNKVDGEKTIYLAIPPATSEVSAEFNHTCFDEDCDPLVGILNDTGKSCCPISSYFALSAEPSEVFRKKLTAFGRRFLILCDYYETDVRKLLLKKAQRLSHDKIYVLFKTQFRNRNKFYRDEDRAEWLFDECSICLSPCRLIRQPPCCRKPTCQICWSTYLKTATSVIGGIKPSSYDLKCYGCSRLVPYREALVSTEPSELKLLRRDDSDLLAHCPICVSEVDTARMRGLKDKTKYYPIECERCGHLFCGICAAEPHPKNSCYEVSHSDAGLVMWMKEQHPNHTDFQNSRFCPNCHIPIFHSGSGCPWVVCACGLEFCFACGERKKCYHAWHRLLRFKLIPIISCRKLWQSQAKRIVSQILFSIVTIFFLIPVTLFCLPVIILVGCFFLIAMTRPPCNRRNRGWHNDD